jgi:signal transduction histidine kinase
MSREIVRAGVFRSLMVALVDHDTRLVEVRRSVVCEVDVDGRPIPGSTISSFDGEVGRRISLDEDDPSARVARGGEMEVTEGEEPDRHGGTRGRAAYFIPIKKEDHVLAVMATASPTDQRDEILGRIEIMRPLLNQVAIAIEHARLYRETQRSEHETRVRLAVQRVRADILQMERDSDWSRVLKVLRRELRTLVQYHGCGINLVHPEGRVMSYSAGRGMRGRFDDPELPLPLREALTTGEPVYRRNTEEMMRGGDRRNLVEAGIQCVVDVPFATGTLAMNSLEPEAFDDEDIDILTQFAAVMSEGHRRLEDLRTLSAKERQLQQAQKMEAVGQLTAGIAHNFNNMLQAITGNLDLALTDAEGDVKRLVTNAVETSDRAAEMVQQLMVYSRQGKRLEHRHVDVTPGGVERRGDLPPHLRPWHPHPGGAR